MMTPRSHGAASVVRESPQAGPFLEASPFRDFAELAWAHGDGLVLRGLVSLPVVPGPGRARG